MSDQLSFLLQRPCRQVIGTQGKKAVHSGSTAEDVIFCILKERGYQVIRQANVGIDIYGSEAQCDFLVHGVPGMEGGLIIESKWQGSSGSVDQKYPFLVENIMKCYPYPTIIVIGGGGYRHGAFLWLKNQVDGQKLIAVYTFEEFISWAMQTL